MSEAVEPTLLAFAGSLLFSFAGLGLLRHDCWSCAAVRSDQRWVEKKGVVE